MPRVVLVVPLLVVLMALAPAASARSIHQSRHLWATVNVCDTARHPDRIGIRASMPGSGRRGEQMWMRFQVQYRSDVDRKWHNMLRGGDSGFRKVGSARYKARQSGVLFRFVPPSGERYVLRGAVTFEWRRGQKVVRRARKATRAGHRARGADPRGYSRSRCVLRG